MSDSPGSMFISISCGIPMVCCLLVLQSKKTESLITKCAELEQKMKESDQLVTCYRVSMSRSVAGQMPVVVY